MEFEGELLKARTCDLGTITGSSIHGTASINREEHPPYSAERVAVSIFQKRSSFLLLGHIEVILATLC